MEHTIGPYRIDRRLGLGGMGIVYAAHDDALDRPVALKVISPQLAHDPEFRERFVREARAMASLDSPHVVRVYAHGEHEGQPWIATQLFAGGDLGTLLRRSGPPPLPVALDLMTQVAAGLADAHAVGLVHRDIKPANVLLRSGSGRTGDWVAALGDFGIARAAADQTGITQTHAAVGTPSYMAPELHTGAGASVASDVYSLGCLVWATLSGTTPFQGSTDYEVMTAHLEEPAPQLAGDSPAIGRLNATLRRALAKDPTQRHAGAAELRDELAAAARTLRDADTVELAAATPTSGPAPARDEPSGSRRGPLLAVLAVLVVTGLAVAGWVGFGLGDDDPRADGESTSSASERTTEEPTEPATPEPTTTEPTTTDPTTDPTDPTGPASSAGGAEQTPEPGPDGWSSEDRRRATDSFIEALATQSVLDEETSRCVAGEILEGEGLQEMVDARYFDQDWNYVDHDIGAYPSLQTRFASATLGCASGG